MEAWDSSNDTLRKYPSGELVQVHVSERVVLGMQYLSELSLSPGCQGTSTTHPPHLPPPPKASLSVASFPSLPLGVLLRILSGQA